jgi:uncharacterized protein (UPF0335 family)
MSNGHPTLEEFIERLTSIENEAKLLSEDRKMLIDEYKEKLDMKAVQAAIKIAKIKAKLGDSEGYMEQILDTVEAKIGVE